VPSRRKLVAIVGPTAVGKTALSLALAGEFCGEIISADSRQIYRRMDIGTAKVTGAERAQAPHHLIDIADPDETVTLGQYRTLAAAALEETWEREHLPLVVGGSGLYVRALLEGWTVPEVPPNEELRQALYLEVQQQGEQLLHRWLSALDPEAAERIDGRNVRRVIRALEVTLETGVPITQLQRRIDPGYTALWLGLTLSRDALYRRIDARVDRMVSAGLVDEVACLLASGYGEHLPAMSGLGYRQVVAFLAGRITLEEAIEQVKYQTHQFVRQQYNWFRLSDPRIHWLDASGDVTEQARCLVHSFLVDAP
jgi:tRNA dimethylallyltransferase